MHVVLVDPSRLIRKAIARMLLDGGHTVMDFDDSARALAYVTGNPSVSCVLTSLEVQPLDGLELCWSLRALAEDRRPLSILAMSSARESRPLDEVLDSGADDFLDKPPSVRELYGRLRSAERVLKLQTALIKQADTDHLTQLLNRGALLRQANIEIQAAGSDQHLSVLQVDIDHFKGINDRYGHDVGDLVIRSVAQTLRETGATTGRLGGEEYALLLPGHSPMAGMAVAQNIRRICAAQRCSTGLNPLQFHGQHRPERMGTGGYHRHIAQARRYRHLRRQNGRAKPRRLHVQQHDDRDRELTRRPHPAGDRPPEVASAAAGDPRLLASAIDDNQEASVSSQQAQPLHVSIDQTDTDPPLWSWSIHDGDLLLVRSRPIYETPESADEAGRAALQEVARRLKRIPRLLNPSYRTGACALTRKPTGV